MEAIELHSAVYIAETETHRDRNSSVKDKKGELERKV